eukprot:CAMPEP_0185018970 /NCGR_PEP_ID=MMETSP1103-20130426/1615_1 /TAXON_ID=36769 /ORGANISM="Paraphysomonas bandaiensis, Strain Caron Lab Isolate" /LENGTH=310 /DNA_ID=CAMNT_0027549027 /DNA_START=135 /DNA_END=1063 /DNA_ORIENTATION=-
MKGSFDTQGFESVLDLQHEDLDFALIIISSPVVNYERTRDVLLEANITCTTVLLFRRWTTKELQRAVNVFPRNFYFGSYPLKESYLRNVLATEQKRLNIGPSSDWPFELVPSAPDDAPKRPPHVNIVERLFQSSTKQVLTPRKRRLPNDDRCTSNKSTKEDAVDKKVTSTSWSQGGEEQVILIVGHNEEGGPLKVIFSNCKVAVEKYFRGTCEPGVLFADLFPGEANCASLRIVEQAVATASIFSDNIRVKLTGSNGKSMEMSVVVYPLDITLDDFIGSHAYIAMGSKLVYDDSGKAIIPKASVILTELS